MAIAQRCTVFAAITAAALLTAGRCWVHGAEPSPDAGERTELTSDPTGPDTGVCRIVRGDDCFVCWTFLNADGACMAASRGEGRRPEDVSRTLGFRIVQIPVSTPKASESP